jgi:hypothetical protein
MLICLRQCTGTALKNLDYWSKLVCRLRQILIFRMPPDQQRLVFESMELMYFRTVFPAMDNSPDIACKLRYIHIPQTGYGGWFLPGGAGD